MLRRRPGPGCGARSATVIRSAVSLAAMASFYTPQCGFGGRMGALGAELARRRAAERCSPHRCEVASVRRVGLGRVSLNSSPFRCHRSSPKRAERLAKKQNGTMSELFQEGLRRLQQEQQRPLPAVLRDLGAVIRLIQQDARRVGLDKMTMAEINADVEGARKEMRVKSKETGNRSRKRPEWLPIPMCWSPHYSRSTGAEAAVVSTPHLVSVGWGCCRLRCGPTPAQVLPLV